MQAILVEFSFTAQTFSRAQMLILLYFFKSGWAKWVLLLAAALWLASKLWLNNASPIEMLNTLIWVPLFIGIWWLLMRWLTQRQFSKLPALQHPIQYTFGEENVTIKTHTAEAVMQWSSFQKAIEARDFFLLFQNVAIANVVMKSGFQNDADLEQFRQMLRVKNLMKA